MFSRTLALSHSMECCLPTFSPNPHLEKEPSQHLPDRKLTESNSPGLMVDPSFFQIHPRSSENKYSATACAEAPAGRADCRESWAPPVIPSESGLLTPAKHHPLSLQGWVIPACWGREGRREGGLLHNCTNTGASRWRRSGLRSAGLLPPPSSSPASKESLTVQV